uniref:Uncharacterized protein n=1 Tax=Pseudonaja textilis TaxID=8673 RepID=A0A670YUH2_PSETE
MERKEQRGGSSGGGRRTGGGSGGGGVAGGSEPGPCEDGTVVQRTQVVLLAGESWGSDGGQTVLSSFAHHVLPPTSAAVSAGGPVGSAEPCAPVATRPFPAPSSLPSTPSGQLIFFLCRPSSLRERPDRLREVLQGVRDQSRNSPAALVGVVVQPRPDEEKPALLQLEKLLREIFQPEGAGSMEVHTAVFAPGRPDGALELKRVKDGALGEGLSLTEFPSNPSIPHHPVTAEEASWLRSETSSKKNQKVQLPFEKASSGLLHRSRGLLRADHIPFTRDFVGFTSTLAGSYCYQIIQVPSHNNNNQFNQRHPLKVSSVLVPCFVTLPHEGGCVLGRKGK